MTALTRLRRSRKAGVALAVAALAHPTPEVRWRTAYALGKTRQRQALEGLLGLLDDPDEMVQMETLFALQYLCDPRSLAPLAERVAKMVVDDPRRDLGPGLLAYLAETHPKQAEEVLRTVTSAARWELISGLAGYYERYQPEETPATRDLLRSLVDDPNPQIRELVTEALVV
jgi:HEAT repeat protein